LFEICEFKNGIRRRNRLERIKKIKKRRSGCPTRWRHLPGRPTTAGKPIRVFKKKKTVRERRESCSRFLEEERETSLKNE